jgi:ABC-type glycerol-3-phosphate transport system substrate-binding protein
MEETEIMQPSRRTFLKGAGAAVGTVVLGRAAGPRSLDALAASKTPVTVWASPMVYGVSAEAPVLDPYLNSHIAAALPDVQFTSDHGPGPYANMESKYLVQAKTGTPDVIEGLLENVVAYVRAGDIVPIDSQFKAWSDYSQFVPSAINAVQYNGQTLGIPYNTNARGMLYRKSILKKLGLKPPTTWDELVTAAEHITAKLSGTTGMAGVMFCTSLTDPRGAQEFLGLFFQTNQHLFKLDSTGKKWMVNTTPAELTKVLELYYNLYFGSSSSAAVGNQSGAAGISSYVQDPGYCTGLWAMVPMGPWLIARQAQGALQKQILTEDTGVISMPVGPGGKPASYLEVKPWMLNKYSKNPDKAWEVMQFLSSKATINEWVTIEGFTPPRKDVLNSPVVQKNWWARSFAELLPQGIALDPLNWAPVYTAILTQMQAVVFGQSKPAAAAAALHTALSGFASQGLL